MVVADESQVEAAVLNLGINARDAMPSGGRLIIECANARVSNGDVAHGSEAVAGDFAVLSVSDTGIGMSAETMARSFEPFFTTKEVGRGSGLGLSMVYGFARQSGGFTVVNSEEGQGTTVKLYLPRASDVSLRQEDVSLRQEIGDGDETPMGKGELILIVEDDSDVGTAIMTILEDLSYRAIHVTSAADAREALVREGVVDLVLCDVVLPGGTSGPDLAKEARKTYQDLKVIFMSGYPADSAIEAMELESSDDILMSKPLLRRRLAFTLRSELD